MHNLLMTLLHSQYIHGRNVHKMIDLVIPQSEKARDEQAIILRWEDDGGKTIEINHLALDQKRRNPMHKRVGLWIDRKKAVIVSIADNIEGKRIITSDMENYVLYSTIVPGDGSPENIRDRRFWNHLGEYYDKIVAHIGDATEIQIFGPEVAKYELQKRLESEGLGQNIVSLEEADKMTDHQIAAKVQKRFPIGSRFELF